MAETRLDKRKMANNGHYDAKAITAALQKRTEAYANKVRQQFGATVGEIIALHKRLPKMEEGQMYSFDAQSARVQKEVETLLRRLHASVVQVVQTGIEVEWGEANKACDALVQSCFGKAVLNSDMFEAWKQRNTAAMTAFLERTVKGMDLSDRVWQSAQQLRDELEVAMTVSIGEGESAQAMSRKVRQYLNDPDLMFRRFRYKDADGKWQRKWKKRVKDEQTGKYKFIDYDKDSYQDQWTGKGYYKSAYKNAMRVARTETNMAYRSADYERWRQMDFVLGVRVQLSHSHPVHDICDYLSAPVGSDNRTGTGCYPKDFKWTSWHPQCFCYATPILVSEEEMAKVSAEFAEGREYTPKGEQITEMPKEFRQWLKDNKKHIEELRDKGKEPYFVRDNPNIVQEIWSGKKKLTTLQKAEKRHAARTESEIADIKIKAWDRQLRMSGLALDEAERKEMAKNWLEIEKALGVKKGRMMTVEEADRSYSNPHFSDIDALQAGYKHNCQTCTMVYNLRRCGFNIESMPSPPDNKNIDNFSNFCKRKGLDWKTRFYATDGSEVDYTWSYMSDITDEISDKQAFIENNTSKAGRYEIYCAWEKGDAHVFCVERLSDGSLLWLDPQSGAYGDATKFRGYIEDMKEDLIGVLRTDNKIVNTKFAERLKKTSK